MIGLALIAAVLIGGMGLSWVRVWHLYRQLRREAASQRAKAIDIPPLPTAETLFWRLFEGDGPSVKARQEGGFFCIEGGKQASIYHTESGLVVIVLLTLPSRQAKRFVCHKEDGIVYKEEAGLFWPGDTIHPQQAKNTNRHGMSAASERIIDLLTVKFIQECWRVESHT